MKKIKIVLALLIPTLFISCAKPKEKTANQLLEDQKVRTEIFNEILTNKIYFTEFTERMTENQIGPMACSINVPLLKVSWESEKMDSIISSDWKMMETMMNRMVQKMNNDTSTCHLMVSKVLQNGKLKSYVISQTCGASEKVKTKQNL